MNKKIITWVICFILVLPILAYIAWIFMKVKPINVLIIVSCCYIVIQLLTKIKRNGQNERYIYRYA